MAHRPQHCEITFVVDFLDRCVVSVNAEDQHGQVVGSEGYAVNSFVDKLVNQQDCRGNFYHDPELEIGPRFNPSSSRIFFAFLKSSSVRTKGSITWTLVSLYSSLTFLMA